MLAFLALLNLVPSVLSQGTAPCFNLTYQRIVTVNCASTNGAPVTWTITAVSLCGRTNTVTCTPESGSVFPVGSTPVTCRVEDELGNNQLFGFHVGVTTNCDGCVALECPRETIVVGAERDGKAAVDFEVNATNRCGNALALVTCNPPSGEDFPMGTNTVQCVVTINGAELASCQFMIVVRDQTPPVLTMPRGYSVNCGESRDGQDGRTLNYTVTAKDNVDRFPTVHCQPPVGTFLPVGTNTVTCTATDAAGNSSTNSFTVTVMPGPDCDPTIIHTGFDILPQPDNWDFELGLKGWKRSGSAFAAQPTLGDNVLVRRIQPLKNQMETRIGGDYWRDVGYPIGHHARYWIGTAENHPDQSMPVGTMAGEDPTGWLRSKAFKIEKSYISFLIGGHEDIGKLRVELLVEVPDDTPDSEKIGPRFYQPVFPRTGHGREILRRESWNVQPHQGKYACIRIVDESTTGHLNVDDFRFQNEHPWFTPIAVGCTNIAPVFSDGPNRFDWDSPVWGFADLHTHPMSHLGMGGKFMHGRPGGLEAPTVQMALGDCNCSHGGPGTDNHCGDYYRELLMKVTDSKGNSAHREGYDENPWKQFRNWPVFSTIVHQQMWHEWIRRAYDGGLRTMVALCVNNPLLGKVSKGDLPRDDVWVGTNQIIAMKQFAALHQDFCAIAYDPFQLREIVRQNKLAIVLGSELDDIGNFNGLPIVDAYATNGPARAASEILVKAELQSLYDQGIRYMFPVHLIDNKFGGTAVGSVMLNVANKFSNGDAFDLEPAPYGENITFKMDDLEYSQEAILGGLGALVLGPALPLAAGSFLELKNAIEHGDADGEGTKLGGIGTAILPAALIGAASVVVLNGLGVDPVPPEIWPVGNNFPAPPLTATGHRNKRGLTPLGQFAVKEMMRLGMMLDIDHMGYHTASNVFALAESVPGGYPLNSGHNSPRDLGKERHESHRTASDYERILKLGGLAGLGFENSDQNSFASDGPPQTLGSSAIENDNAGSSKTFGQIYLYAFEKMQGRQIAFGTDINGFIAGPSPRFGPQGAFATHETSYSRRDDQIRAQGFDGVLYTPRHGKPLTTPAFVGPAVDPNRDTDEPARRGKGYEYNQDQRDFFAALRIFNWNNTASEDTLKDIESALSDSYPNKRRVKEYAFGLVKGVTGQAPGWDANSPDTETREQLGQAVQRFKGQGILPPVNILIDPKKFFRYQQHCKVWDDYQKIFGTNTPMTRCTTLAKEWDINFEGVAHYGLLPDLLQDMRNVGLKAEDLSPMFLSTEHFAQMWVKCLKGSAAIKKPKIEIKWLKPGVYGVEWFADDGDVLETTDDLGNPDTWRAYHGATTRNGYYKRAEIQTGENEGNIYFRVRK